MPDYEYNGNRKFGYSKAERIEEINRKITESNQTFDVDYQGRVQSLPVIRVNIGLLVYRIENFRTASLQKEYLAEHIATVDANYFKFNPDSIEVQKTQHELLQKLIKEKGLLESFEKEKQRGQTQPLIITDEGVVVNGNRRLCAWRELFYRHDNSRYASFQTIEVAVLPDHDADSIVELEMNLQIKPELKAEYSWHAKAISFNSELARTGLQAKDLERKYDLPSGSVQTTIDAYHLAEKYLSRIGKKDNWSLVDGEEFAFRQMLSRSSRLDSEGDPFAGDLFEEVCFDVIVANHEKKLPEGTGRVYSIIQDIDKYFPDVAQHIKTKVIPTEVEKQAEFFKQEIGELPSESAVILQAVKSSDPVQIARAVVRETKVKKDMEREAKGQRYISSQIRKALDALGTAVLADKVGQSTAGIAEMLGTIESNVTSLRQWLDDNANTN